MDSSYYPIGDYQDVADLSAVVELTPPTGRFDGLLVTVYHHPVTYTVNGQDPAENVTGHVLAAGSTTFLPFGGRLGTGARFKFIENAAGAHLSAVFCILPHNRAN